METSNTLWHLYLQNFSSKPDYQQYDVGDLNNTLVASFSDAPVLESGETVQIRQRCVVRRFVQGNRILSTWKFGFEGEGIFSGLMANETG